MACPGVAGRRLGRARLPDNRHALRLRLSFWPKNRRSTTSTANSSRRARAAGSPSSRRRTGAAATPPRSSVRSVRGWVDAVANHHPLIRAPTERWRSTPPSPAVRAAATAHDEAIRSARDTWGSPRCAPGRRPSRGRRSACRRSTADPAACRSYARPSSSNRADQSVSRPARCASSESRCECQPAPYPAMAAGGKPRSSRTRIVPSPSGRSSPRESNLLGACRA